MSTHSVIISTTGPAGTGKSLFRGPVYLLREFLAHREGVHWSNFPLGEVPGSHIVPPVYEGETFRERIACEAARRHGGEPADYRERIQVIPPAEIEAWRTGRSGPWAFFKDVDLGGAHVAIDECHEFIGRKTPAKVRRQWQSWLGEIRHRGATVEFLSQSPAKVAKEIDYESGARIELRSSEDVRDPICGIPLGDWYNLRAKFLTREYDSVVFIRHYRQGFGGRWKVAHSERGRIEPEYFKFYNSFSRPHAGGGAAATEKRPWERYSAGRLLAWFIVRNFGRLTSRVAILAVGLFFLFGGGGPVISAAFAFMPKPHRPGEQLEAGPAVRVAGPGGVVRPASAASPVQPADAEVDPELAAAEATIKRLEADLLALEADRDRWRSWVQQATAVALVTPSTVKLRGGYEYRAGDVIDYGQWAGRKIVSIDYARRSVHLDDGAVLRMGLSSSGPGRGALPPVPIHEPAVPGVDRDAAGGRSAGQVGAAGDPLGGVHAVGAVGSLD